AARTTGPSVFCREPPPHRCSCSPGPRCCCLSTVFERGRASPRASRAFGVLAQALAEPRKTARPPFAKPSVEGALPEASVDFDGAVRSAAVAVGRPGDLRKARACELHDGDM